LSLDHTHWVKSRDRFFLSIHVLRRVFRGKFVAALRQAFQEGQLNFRGNLTCLAQSKTFAAWLRPLFRKDWVVYAKPPFGGPEYVLQYLGRYTHRAAISNHRLASFAGGKVTFRWRDSAHNNEQKSFGERLPKCGTYQVNEKLAEGVSAELRDVLVPLLREVESLNERSTTEMP
jgi:hypothetical protein